MNRSSISQATLKGNQEPRSNSAQHPAGEMTMHKLLIGILATFILTSSALSEEVTCTSYTSNGVTCTKCCGVDSGVCSTRCSAPIPPVPAPVPEGRSTSLCATQVAFQSDATAGVCDGEEPESNTTKIAALLERGMDMGLQAQSGNCPSKSHTCVGYITCCPQGYRYLDPCTEDRSKTQYGMCYQTLEDARAQSNCSTIVRCN